jgi:hypothetical protein
MLLISGEWEIKREIKVLLRKINSGYILTISRGLRTDRVRLQIDSSPTQSANKFDAVSIQRREKKNIGWELEMQLKSSLEYEYHIVAFKYSAKVLQQGQMSNELYAKNHFCWYIKEDIANHYSITRFFWFCLYTYDCYPISINSCQDITSSTLKNTTKLSALSTHVKTSPAPP